MQSIDNIEADSTTTPSAPSRQKLIALMPNIVTSQDFIDSWEFKLEHDFAKEGKSPQSRFSSRQWGSEDYALALPTTGKPHSISIAISSSETMVAIALDNEVLVYDYAHTGALALSLRNVFRGHAGVVNGLAFHPQGRFLVSSARRSRLLSEEVIRLWELDDTSDGQKENWDTFTDAMITHSSFELKTHRNWSTDDIASVISYNADLKKSIQSLFTAMEIERDLRRGDALEGHFGSFGSNAFSHDGYCLMYLTQRPTNEVVVYDIADRKERFHLVGHKDSIMWTGSSPKHDVLASSSWDGTAKIWRADTGALVHTLQGDGQLWAGQFTPSGDLLAVTSGMKRVFVWNVDTADLVSTLEGYPGWVRSLDFHMSANGLCVASGSDGGVWVHHLETGKRIQHWKVKGKSSHFYEISSVKYSPDGFSPHVLGFKAPDGRIVLYNMENNIKWEFEQPLRESPRYYGSGQFVFSKTTSSVLSADMDGVLRIWKL
ncbi:hypothetical protein H0H93_007558 [Arthromyces matolae]|nr:hypothetical protein H0H93_007558 [Arthromyces matolae]